MKKILIAVLLFVGFTADAQGKSDKVVDKIKELGVTDNRAMQHLDVLSNRIGGRPIGSDAYSNATQWAAREMRKWGMDVLVEQVGTLPVGFNRGAWFGRMLSHDGMTLHFATPSYTSGTKGVQRGHVLMEPQTISEFNRIKGALRGAWVLVKGTSLGWPIDYSARGDSLRNSIKLYNDTITILNRSIKDRKDYKAYRMEPALFYREMCEAGILGIIQSAPVPITALYDRKNLEKMDFDNLPTIPDIKLDEAQYAVIAEKVRRRDYFQLEFDIRNHFKPGPVAYHNVIGVIRGTQYPDQYVMAGGHLDSFDVSTGGVDCGSGSTVTMEAGRLIMAAAGGVKPKRSILICLWAGEEFGLLGSKHWVETHAKELHGISNYFNRDGGPTVIDGLTVPSDMYPIFEKICQPLNSINPDFPFTLHKSTAAPRPRPKSAGGSDHAYFMLNGVPTLSFSTADSKGYNFSYGEIWHTERDTYDKSIAPYQEHSATVTAIVLWGLANTDKSLPRAGLFVD